MNIDFKQQDTGLKIMIASELLAKIRGYALIHYPNEFGGILLGHYSDDGKTAVISCIETPDRYYNSTGFFTRHVKRLNRSIKKLYSKSQGKIIYMGEWHSHPNGSPQYSGVDHKTMSEIASSKKVKVASPILLIVGITEEEFTPEFYIYHNSNLLRYEPSQN